MSIRASSEFRGVKNIKKPSDRRYLGYGERERERAKSLDGLLVKKERAEFKKCTHFTVC